MVFKDSFKCKLIGIWDLNKADLRMGPFLIFQEELLLLSYEQETERIDLIFILPERSVSFPYLAILAQLNPKVDSICFAREYETFIQKEENLKTNFWPQEDLLGICSYSGSFLAVQKFWRKNGKLINLKSPHNVKQKANSWMKKYLGNSISITVHMKNNPNDHQSNANQEAWFTFFKYVGEKMPHVKFLIIGSDEVKNNIKKLANVVYTNDNGASLELDFALIEQSLLFMGMAAGPSTIAILSDLPYLIWKHPGHHAEEMNREFQGCKQFVFANKYQQFMLDWDKSGNMINKFNELYSQLKLDSLT